MSYIIPLIAAVIGLALLGPLGAILGLLVWYVVRTGK